MKRLLAGLAGLLFAVVVPVRANAVSSIQPGDDITTSVGSCTLGFAADGPGGVYFMTAAHCVDHVDEAVILDDGSTLGTVAAVGNAANTSTDWSLIRVAPIFEGAVSGVVRGHGAPTGVAASGENGLGDVLDYSGYGIPWFVAAPLREMRFGILTDQSPQIWAAIGPHTFGDSGGPVLVQGTGKALGLVSGIPLGCICTTVGPTVEGILPQMAAAGFPMTLRGS